MTATRRRQGLAAEGARRLLRHPRVLCGVFGVGFALALLGALPVRTAAGRVLGHSLLGPLFAASDDLPLLAEVMGQLPTGALAGAGIGLQVVFFVFLLFVAGGTLAVYRGDRWPGTADFFRDCGRYFWRIVRLTLLSAVPLALAGAVLAVSGALSSRVGEATPLESRPVLTFLAGAVLAGLVLLSVRLWFDVAQAIIVVDEERSAWRAAWRGLWVTARSLGRLLSLYVAVTLGLWAAVAGGLWLWLRVPSKAFAASFLLLQLLLLLQLAARLLLRASVVAWYAQLVSQRVADGAPQARACTWAATADVTAAVELAAAASAAGPGKVDAEPLTDREPGQAEEAVSHD